MKYYCPRCDSVLVKGDPERYQTSDEHCTAPNDEHPPRTTYRCANQNCELSPISFWSIDGEFFSTDFKAYRELYPNADSLDAKGSMWYSIRRTMQYSKDHTKVIRIPFSHGLKIVGHADIDKMGVVKKRRHSWHIEKYDGNAVSPWDVGMFWYVVKLYFRSRKYAKSGGADIFSETLIEFTMPVSEWKKKDWWRRWAHKVCSLHLRMFPIKGMAKS